MQGTRRLLVIYAQTPVHAGSGTTVGAIDLPIQREVHTGFPLIAASGLKGSLRAKARTVGLDKREEINLFGTEVGTTPTVAGLLSVGDARILAFPVRSLDRVFFWVTCPLVLNRLSRDLRVAGYAGWSEFSQVRGPSEGTVLVPQGSELESEHVILEDVQLNAVTSSQFGNLTGRLAEMLPEEVGDYIKDLFRSQLLLVHDNDFAYFVRHCTQVNARIQLTSHKTTGPVKETGEKGNLWYEETLPPETILYSLVMTTAARPGNSRIEVPPMEIFAARVLHDGLLQLGGNETVGHGWCWVRLVGGDD